MKQISKAELKRRLVPGTKLVLVNCLLGPCHKPRTVHQVRSGDIVMLTPEGRHSYLTISSSEVVRETENGFQIVVLAYGEVPGIPAQPERIAAEYIYAQETTPTVNL